MQPLISVIVPVYNVEKYLEPCVRSLLAQSWQNLEVLLVDDGSTDHCPQICDRLAQEDSRVRVIHKPNGGVAAARNDGLRQMRGDLFCFCDSDDTVRADYLQRLYETLQQENADIAECAYVFAWENGETRRTKNFEFPDDYITCHSGRDAVCDMMYAQIHSPFCMCKLFRKSVQVHFPKMKVGEDLLAICDAYLKAERVAFTNQPLYLYLQRQGSAIHSEDPEKIFETVLSAERLMEKIDLADRQLHEAAAYFVPLFERYGVDLVLQGAEANYERTFPMYQGEPNPRGVTYVTLGGGGAAPARRAGSDRSTARFVSAYHYADVTISDRKLTMTVYNEQGVQLDKLELYI